MKTMPLVSIVTVNYNGKKFLRDCFKSLLNLNYPKNKLEIFMVDNGSHDGSVDYVKKGFPNIRIIINDENNYAKANNLAIKKAQGKYVVLINNDVKVDKDWLITLVKTAQRDNSIGAVGSKILFMDGSIQSVGHQEYPNFYWGDIGFRENDAGQHNFIKEVTSLSGCSLLYRRRCLKDVGLLDEDLNMFIEDVDMAIRCRKKGWKLAICPESIIYHKFHGTIGNEVDAKYWQEINRLLLIAKHWPEKLVDAFAGKGFFTVKNEYIGYRAKDISTVLGKVFLKLIKEHGWEFTNRLSPDLFKAVRLIYNFEKDHLIQVVKDNSLMISKQGREIKTLIEQLASLNQQKEQAITALRQQKEQEINALNQQKEQEINALNQQKEQAITALRQQKEQAITALRQQKEQEVNAYKQQKDQEIINLTQQKEQEIATAQQEIESQTKLIEELEKDNEYQKISLGYKQQELQGIYTSTGYRYLLRPLWEFLWCIKQKLIWIKNSIVFLRAQFKSNFASVVNSINKAFKWGINISDITDLLNSKQSLKRVYLNHLRYTTFPVIPKRLIMMVTRNCNLRCVFCDVPQIEKRLEFMPREESFRIIDSAARLGIKEIELTGGEPLLHPNLFEIVNHADSKNMNVVLTTNGILIKQNIGKILENKFYYICFSIDGMELTHDTLRNYTGAYRQAMEAIALLKEHKLTVAINFVVTNKNVFELEKIYDYFLAHNIKVIFFPVINKPDLFLSKPEERKALFKFIKKLYRQRRISKYEYSYLKDTLFIYFAGKDVRVRCLGLNLNLGVDVDGDISPCCVWQNRKDELVNLGNVFIDDLERLWFSPGFHKARLSIFNEGCEDCFNPSIYEFKEIIGRSYLVKKDIKHNRDSGVCRLKNNLKPLHVHFRFTSRCNLSCRHCDIWKNLEKIDYNNELSVSQWQECIDKLYDWLGKFRLDLAGGEILLYKGAIDLVEYGARKGIKINLTTNATNITTGTAKKIIDSGLYAINLSLDGLAKTHEYTRNQKDGYCRVQEVAFRLLGYRENKRPFVTISTVITKYNLEELNCIVELVDKWGVDGVSFQALDHNFGAVYYDNWFKNNEFWPDDYKKVEYALDNLIRTKISSAKICNSFQQLNDIKKYYRNPIEYTQHKCLTGDVNLIVDEFGGIRLCWNMSPIGNILKHSPQQIWHSKFAMKNRRTIHNCKRTCRILNCNYG